jgi:uncharacterized membrane protein
MTRSRFCLLSVSCVVGFLDVAASDLTRFQTVRGVLGLLMVLAIPGFALVSAAFPKGQFSCGEWLLASVGASLVISTVSSVALGAAPIGLSRLSFSLVLGICTLVFSITALMRARN